MNPHFLHIWHPTVGPSATREKRSVSRPDPAQRTDGRIRGVAKARGRQGSASKGIPLAAVFKGRCRLEIPGIPAAALQEAYPLSCDIVFSAARDAVTLVEFDTIRTRAYAAAVGPTTVTNRTTVHLVSAKPGRLTRDGHFAIPVILHFDHSVDLPFYEEDSDLALTLSTRVPGGSPLDARGSVTLVGEGRFSGGHLAGRACRLAYEGIVSPRPW